MQLKIAAIGTGSIGMNHTYVLRDFDEEYIRPGTDIVAIRVVQIGTFRSK